MSHFAQAVERQKAQADTGHFQLVEVLPVETRKPTDKERVCQPVEALLLPVETVADSQISILTATFLVQSCPFS